MPSRNCKTGFFKGWCVFVVAATLFSQTSPLPAQIQGKGIFIENAAFAAYGPGNLSSYDPTNSVDTDAFANYLKNTLLANWVVAKSAVGDQKEGEFTSQFVSSCHGQGLTVLASHLLSGRNPGTAASGESKVARDQVDLGADGLVVMPAANDKSGKTNMYALGRHAEALQYRNNVMPYVHNEAGHLNGQNRRLSFIYCPVADFNAHGNDGQKVHNVLLGLTPAGTGTVTADAIMVRTYWGCTKQPDSTCLDRFIGSTGFIPTFWEPLAPVVMGQRQLIVLGQAQPVSVTGHICANAISSHVADIINYGHNAARNYPVAFYTLETLSTDDITWYTGTPY